MTDCIECGLELSSSDEIAERDLCDNCYRQTRRWQKEQEAMQYYGDLRSTYIDQKGGKR